MPGCGKTTHIVRHFDEETEIVATTTIEAEEDLRENLANRFGGRTRKRVRTMASILINGFVRASRIMVDEALMFHFRAIMMAARLSCAEVVTLIGDINQLSYIDKNNQFELRYCRPSLTANITHKLSCPHRSPMDVAYAITGVYDNFYFSNPIDHSLKMEKFYQIVQELYT